MVKIGPAFGDYIRLEKSQRHPGDSGRSYSIRSYILPLILVAGIALIIIRLFFLQIIKGNDYRNLSDANRTRTISIHAPRGVIFDRNGTPLVFNFPGFREKVGEKTLLLNKDDALKLLSEGKTNLEIDTLRNYPYKDATAHVLGYVGQISEEELKQKDSSNYRGGDLVGKIGIEKEYESSLKGIDGRELVEIDSMGRVVRKLGQTDPISGQNIALTLDVALQKAAFDAAKDVKKGAVIVSTPKGEILALVSKPSFDDNLFTMGEGYSTEQNSSYNSVSQILMDSANQPLLNRVIGGTYPPGSTFKLVTAAAGLQDKIIDKNFTIEDTGILKLGTFSFGNWYFLQYGRTDGEVNVVKAIQRSNDIFFYKLAEMIGVDKLSQFAGKFGLGKKQGIDLAGEQAGTVPTEEWKKSVIGEQWYLGDTYHYGIGQGFLLTTPLQINTMTQALANKGVLYQPHLLKNINPNILSQNILNAENFDLIRQGMVAACSTGGVAWPLFDFKVKGKPVSVACKTGTAQHGGEETLPHAWITLFAPADNPQIVVTVLSEQSGEGSNVAAPIAKKVLEEWFGR